MKMGTIVSPWRHDSIASDTLQLASRGRSAIQDYAFWIPVLRVGPVDRSVAAIRATSRADEKGQQATCRPGSNVVETDQIQRYGGVMLRLSIWRAKYRIRRIARRYCPHAKVFTLGAVWLSPRNLAFWITTKTDAERDSMRTAPNLISGFRQALLDAGYPTTAVADVGFEFEAQQTVDREYNGNWWYRVK
jgi:hypothetical protein